MNEEKPILTIVEELKGLQMKNFTDRMYDPDFWLPFIPLKSKQITEIIPEQQYHFKVNDIIHWNPTGSLRKELDAEGDLFVNACGQQGNQGFLWEITVQVESLQAEVGIHLRVKDLPGALKVGIYIHKLEYYWGLLEGIGRDAVLFAARTKLREFLLDTQKKLK